MVRVEKVPVGMHHFGATATFKVIDHVPVLVYLLVRLVFRLKLTGA